MIYYCGDLQLEQRCTYDSAFDATGCNAVSTRQLAGNVRTFDTTFGNLRADGIDTLNASLATKFYMAENQPVGAPRRFQSA